MRQRTLLLIGGAIAVIVLLGAVTAIFLSQQTHLVAGGVPQTPIEVTVSNPGQAQEGQHEVSAPTVAPAADSASGLISASTSSPELIASPERVAAPPTPILFDDFSQLTSGWSPLFIDSLSNVNGYSAEAYAFDIATNDQLLYDVRSDLNFAATHYAVDVRHAAGDGQFGLMFNVRGDPMRLASLEFYVVQMTTQGDVALVFQPAGGQPQVLQSSVGVSPARMSDQSSRLEIEQRLDVLVVRINGSEVLRSNPLPASEGGIGLMAHSGGVLRVEFDNLLISASAEVDQPACSGLRLLFLTDNPNERLNGPDVSFLQQRLFHLGYDPGGIDGVYGPRTAEAVGQFQTRSELVADSVAGPQTWCMLFSDAAVDINGRVERSVNQEIYRPIALDPGAGLNMPLLVSVRNAMDKWQIGLALPGRSALNYIDTQGDAFDPAWLPGSGLLAFTSLRSGDDHGEIWMLDTQSGMVRQISPPKLDSQFPAWEPDGQTLMFTAEPIGSSSNSARNYVYDLRSGQFAQWRDDHAGWSDWAPDGMVAFTHWTGKSFDIFIAGPDGSNAVNITNSDETDEDIPAWSPDSQWIAFVRNPRANSADRQIYIARRDGSELRQLTMMPGPNSNPIWLDATTLAFANQPNDDVRQPYILQIDGATRQLSENDGRMWFMSRLDLE